MSNQQLNNVDSSSKYSTKATILTDYLSKMLQSDITNNNNSNTIKGKGIPHKQEINLKNNDVGRKNLYNKENKEFSDNNCLDELSSTITSYFDSRDKFSSPNKCLKPERVRSPKLVYKRKNNESASFLSNNLEEVSNSPCNSKYTLSGGPSSASQIKKTQNPTKKKEIFNAKKINVNNTNSNNLNQTNYKRTDLDSKLVRSLNLSDSEESKRGLHNTYDKRKLNNNKLKIPNTNNNNIVITEKNKLLRSTINTKASDLKSSKIDRVVSQSPASPKSTERAFVCKNCNFYKNKIKELENVVNEQELLIIAYKNQEAFINVNYNYNNNYNNINNNGFPKIFSNLTKQTVSNLIFPSKSVTINIKSTSNACLSHEKEIQKLNKEITALSSFKDKVFKVSFTYDEFNDKVNSQISLMNKLVNDISKDMNTYIIDQKMFNKEELQVRIRETYMSLINNIKSISKVKHEEYSTLIKEKNREINELKQTISDLRQIMADPDDDLNILNRPDRTSSKSIENYYEKSNNEVQNTIKSQNILKINQSNYNVSGKVEESELSQTIERLRALQGKNAIKNNEKHSVKNSIDLNKIEEELSSGMFASKLSKEVESKIRAAKSQSPPKHYNQMKFERYRNANNLINNSELKDIEQDTLLISIYNKFDQNNPINIQTPTNEGKQDQGNLSKINKLNVPTSQRVSHYPDYINISNKEVLSSDNSISNTLNSILNSTVDNVQNKISTKNNKKKDKEENSSVREKPLKHTENSNYRKVFSPNLNKK